MCSACGTGLMQHWHKMALAYPPKLSPVWGLGIIMLGDISEAFPRVRTGNRLQNFLAQVSLYPLLNKKAVVQQGDSHAYSNFACKVLQKIIQRAHF